MAEPIKLRSKVVEIEAMQFTGGRENASEIVTWIIWNGGSALWWKDDSELNGPRSVMAEHIAINTLEGTMHAEVGSWVFRGLEGEFYPCKDSVKTAKYDEIKEPTDG